MASSLMRWVASVPPSCLTNYTSAKVPFDLILFFIQSEKRFAEVRMTLISLAMIVKNEGATLEHCLESVVNLVDEMVILDTGSTDNTIEIANRYGAKVRHFEWCHDFSAARNESLMHCTGQWVLIIDADEAIDPLDYEKIRNACLHPHADAYNLIHRNYTLTATEATQDVGVTRNNSKYSEGKTLPFYSDSSALRLAKRFGGLSFLSAIHETLGESVLKHGGTIEPLDVVLHHYGKLLKDREEFKSQYYLMLAKNEADKNPKEKWAQFNLLQQAMVVEQWELVLEAAMASLKLDSTVAPLVLFGAGTALQQMGKHGEAIKYFDLLLAHDPKHVLTIINKGVALEAMGSPDAGRKLLASAIELQPDSALARGRMAELELRLNNFDEARKIILGTLDIYPTEPSLYDILLKIEMARGNPQQATQDAIKGIQQCPNGGEGRWHRLAAVYLCQINQQDTAKSILELGLKAFPGNSDLERLKGLI
jgi:tetratricopeptide (TPR) repeat protein